MFDATDNTYIIDPENAAEMARLVNLDRTVTRAMGGPLAALPELPRDSAVLDLACGPGGWVLDVAYECPDLDVAGVDISQTMIAYANARARSEGRSNASFGVMDIAQTPLDFSDESFSLINARLLVSSLRQERWQPLVQECFRLLQPGGVLRLTETESAGSTNSPSFEHLTELLGLAFRKADYGFLLPGRLHPPVITHLLGFFLRKAGFTQIACKAHIIDSSAGTQNWSGFYQNTLVLFRVVQPFIVKAGIASSEEIERLYQQMQIEMNSDDFCCVWTFVSFWGVKP